MGNIIKSVLAVIGLVVILSHPQAKKALGAVAGYCGNMLATASGVAERYRGPRSEVAVSSAPLSTAEISSLLPADDALAAVPAQTAEPEKKEAADEPASPEDAARDAAGSEAVKVLGIYKDAEADTDGED